MVCRSWTQLPKAACCPNRAYPSHNSIADLGLINVMSSVTGSKTFRDHPPLAKQRTVEMVGAEIPTMCIVKDTHWWMSLTLTIRIRWEDSQQNCKDSVGGGSRTETMTVGGTDGSTARPTNNIQRTMNKSPLPPMRGWVVRWQRSGRDAKETRREEKILSTAPKKRDRKMIQVQVKYVDVTKKYTINRDITRLQSVGKTSIAGHIPSSESEVGYLE